MTRYRFKAFDPKPFEPGARIEWAHQTSDGIVTRTGIVWSGAPKYGACRAMWVTPDAPLPGDAYAAVCVVVPIRHKYASEESRRPYSGDTEDYRFDSPGRRAYLAGVAAAAVRERNARLAKAA